MSRKKKAKAPDTPATEPTPVAEVLAHSPIAEILASREAKAQIEPERAMPEPEDSTSKGSHVQRISQPAPSSIESLVAEALIESQKPKLSHAERLTGLRPTPSGFVGLESFRNAGIRLGRSLDKSVVAIQFADDKRPTRDVLNPEKQRLDDRGFVYKPERAQWERKDREWPAENYQDAKAFVASLVEGRLAGPSAEVGRS